jgi:hypothetical protein
MEQEQAGIHESEDKPSCAAEPIPRPHGSPQRIGVRPRNGIEPRSRFLNHRTEMFNGLRSEVCSGFGMARPGGWSRSRLGYIDLRTNLPVPRSRFLGFWSAENHPAGAITIGMVGLWLPPASMVTAKPLALMPAVCMAWNIMPLPLLSGLNQPAGMGAPLSAGSSQSA